MLANKHKLKILRKGEPGLRVIITSVSNKNSSPSFGHGNQLDPHPYLGSSSDYQKVCTPQQHYSSCNLQDNNKGFSLFNKSLLDVQMSILLGVA